MTIHLRGLDAQLRPYAEYAYQLGLYYGLAPVITSVYRPWEDQLKLYNKHVDCVVSGRFPSPPDCKYPANRPGESAHNYGLAWDSWVPDDQRDLWTAIREYVGWRVLPNDWIHAELPEWRSYVK